MSKKITHRERVMQLGDRLVSLRKAQDDELRRYSLARDLSEGRVKTGHVLAYLIDFHCVKTMASVLLSQRISRRQQIAFDIAEKNARDVLSRSKQALVDRILSAN